MPCLPTDSVGSLPMFYIGQLSHILGSISVCSRTFLMQLSPLPSLSSNHHYPSFLYHWFNHRSMLIFITASPQAHFYPHPFPLPLHPLSSNSQHHLIQLTTPSSFNSFLTQNLVCHILLTFSYPYCYFSVSFAGYSSFPWPWNAAVSPSIPWPSTHSICWWSPDLYPAWTSPLNLSTLFQNS